MRDRNAQILDSVVRAGARFAIGLYVARLLGPSGYGTIVLLLTAEIMVQALVQAAFATPLLSKAPGMAEAQRWPWECYAFSSIRRWFLPIGIGAILVASALELGPAAALAYGGALAAACVLSVLRAVQQARFRSHRALIADVLAGSVPWLFLALRTEWDLSVEAALFLGMAAGNLAGSLACGLLDSQRRTLRLPVADPTVARESREMAYPVAVGSLVNSATSRTHPYLLDLFAGASAVGQLGAAGSLAGPMRLASTTLAGVLRPRLALYANQQRPEDHRRTMRACTLMLATATACAVVASLAIGRPLVTWLYGPGFAEVALLLPPLILFAGLEALGALRTVEMQVCRGSQGAAQATALRLRAGLLGLASAIPLILVLQGMGAVLALVLGEIVYLLGTKAAGQSAGVLSCDSARSS